MEIAQLNAALVGRYLIERVLGRGGMGTVFLALDQRHDRHVALKFVSFDSEDDGAAERFLSEMRTTARLAHQNIVPLFDSGSVDGHAFYVMPYVRGESLADRLEREGHLSSHSVIEIARSVLAALSYAHGTGIVHRDVKPANILLTPHGTIALADFGIAQAREAAGAAGVVAGTPSYMSPEQRAGRTVDGRADLYGLASSILEALIGEVPASLSAPVSVVLRTRRADLPSSLVEAVSRGLAEDQEKRFATAREMADALRDSAPADASPRPEGRAHRHLSWIAGAAAVLLIGALAWPGVLGRLLPTPGARSTSRLVAVAGFTYIGDPELEHLAAGIVDELSERIGTIEGIDAVSRFSAGQFDSLLASPVEIGRELHADHVLYGTIRAEKAEGASGTVRVIPRLVRVADGRQIWSDRVDSSLDPGAIFDAQATVAERLAASLHLALPMLDSTRSAPTASLDAYLAYSRARIFSAQFLEFGALRRAIESYRTALALDPAFALAQARLAQMLSVQYFFFDRTPDGRRAAEDATERALTLDRDLPESLVAAGYLAYWTRLDYNAALDHFQKAAQVMPADADLTWVIGSVLRRQGQYPQAVALFRAAERLDPRSAMVAFELSSSYYLLRQFDSARAYGRRTVDLAAEWLPAPAGQATTEVASGHPDAARALIRRAMEDFDTSQLLNQVVGDVIYRPLWRSALPSEAITEIWRMAPADPTPPVYLHLLKLELAPDSASARAQADSAAALLEQELRARPDDERLRIDLARVEAARGSHGAGLLRIADLTPQHLVSSDGFRGALWAYELAYTRVRLGDLERAEADLAYLLQIPSPASTSLLRTDPGFAPLRGRAVFEALLAGGV